MIRVLMWFPFYQIVSWAIVGKELACYLPHHGVETVVIPWEGWRPRVEDLPPVFSVGDYEAVRRFVPQVVRETPSYGHVNVAEWAKLLNVDIVLRISHPDSFDQMYSVKNVHGKPVVGYTICETVKIPKSWVEESNKVDAVLLPSQRGVEIYRECGVVKPLYYLPHGVDTNRFRPLNTDELKRMRGLEGKTVLLYVGRIDPRKDLHSLIDALSRVVERHRDVVLVIHNTIDVGTAIMDVLDHARRLNVENHVVWIKDLLPHHRMPEIFNLCDIYVHTARAEGFGLPILEAMSCGKPVVVNKTLGAEELVKHLNTGILVDSLAEGLWFRIDVNRLADWLIALIEDERLRRRLGANARIWAENNYTWDIIAERAKEIFSRILTAETAPKYDEQYIECRSGVYTHESFKSELSFVKGIVGSNTLLDVGCGSGEYLKGINAVGVEISRYGAKQAGKVCPALVADAHHLPFQDGSFDYVSMIHVIEHLHNPTKAIDEAVRVCRKGVIVLTPNASIEPPKSDRHVKEYTSRELVALLTGAGLSVVKIVEALPYTSTLAVYAVKPKSVLQEDRKMMWRVLIMTIIGAFLLVGVKLMLPS